MPSVRALRRILICSTLLMGMFGSTVVATAAVIFDMDDTVTLSNTGSFDLFIDLTGTGPDSAASPPTVTAFTLDLTVLSTTGTLLPSDITFGNAGQPASHSALFPPANLATISSGVGEFIAANDGSAVLVSDLVGLVNVPFSVTLGKFGTFTVGYELPITDLGRSTGGSVPITLSTGVQTVAQVPEPSSLVLAGIGAISLIVIARRRVLQARP